MSWLFRLVPKARRGLSGRLRRDESGAALVEFAFVLTPLLILILGGFDLGYQAYLRAALQGALNDIARTASTEAPVIGCTGAKLEDRIECALRARTDIIARDARYDVKIRNFYEFSGVNRSEKLVTDHNRNGRYDTGDCFVDLNRNGAFDQQAGRIGVGGADDVVFYEVTLFMPRLFPVDKLIGFSADYEVSAEIAIRNQPYKRQIEPPTICV